MRLITVFFSCIGMALCLPCCDDAEIAEQTTPGGAGGSAGSGTGGSVAGSSTGGSGTGGSLQDSSVGGGQPEAGAGGTSLGGNAGAGEDGGKVCGGYGGLECGEEEYCDYPDNSYCGGMDQLGLCKPRPKACTQDGPGVCGCDGKYYNSECHAQGNGVDITGNLNCIPDSGKGCGGIAGTKCADNEYCNFPDGSFCGGDDSLGVCLPRPGICPQLGPPACGCDGKYYASACDAQQNGMDVTGDLSCKGDGGAGTVCINDIDCQGNLRCCYPCGQPGCQNECTETPDGGACPALP